jgi:hypothetical protein
MDAIVAYADALETLAQPMMIRHVAYKAIPDRCDISRTLIMMINWAATAVLWCDVLAQSWLLS